jgi:tripartite-type tricarboxylate transporter receptor subunit TctC
VIVENKPGAGGMLGPAAMAANAKPDGYTLSQMPIGGFRIPTCRRWNGIHSRLTYVIGITGYTFASS